MKVKTLAELTGTQPAKEKSNDIEKLISVVLDSHSRDAQNARANTEALVALAKGVASRPVQVVVREAEKPKRWVVTIERDEDGFAKRLFLDAE